MFVAMKNLVGAISDKWESFSKVLCQHFGHFFFVVPLPLHINQLQAAANVR
jgi:hypothetical protein